MHNNLSQAKNIIDYWSWVERFTPPIQTEDNNTLKLVLSDKEIPWFNHTEFQHYEDEMHTWCYTVYIGIIHCDKIVEKLKTLLTSSTEDFERNGSNNESYLCCFEVDINGNPIESSVAIPDYVASMGCLIKTEDLNSDIWLDNFDSIKTKIKKMLNNVFCKLRQTDNHAPLNFALFKDMVNAVQQISEWNELLGDIKNIVRIDSRMVTKPKPKVIEMNSTEKPEYEAGTEPLKLFNSFYFKDLKLISDTIKEDKRIGEALSEYLNITPYPPKADVRKDKELMQTLLSPNSLAPARWPGNGNYPLVLSQQLAVNAFLNSETKTFSVNGPPGTGKTTLLKDVIANIIVLRAEKLAKLISPSNAFSGSENFFINNYNYKIWKLKEEFLGHGIVISSSNNTAVDNITTEIPLSNAIDGKWEADYFSEVASYILGKKCWGLTAASLGKVKKVRDFFDKFWSTQTDNNTVNSFNTVLSENNADINDWQKAKKNFLNCLKQFNTIQQEINKIPALLEEEIKVRKSFTAAKVTHVDLIDKLNTANEKKQELSYQLICLENHISDTKNIISEMKECKPSFFARIWHLLVNRETSLYWDKKYIQKLDTLEDLQENKTALEKQLRGKEQEILSLDKNLKASKAEKQNIQKKLDEIRSEIFIFKEKMGNNFPNKKYWLADDEILQKTSPWNFPELHEIRAKIFIEALNLHKVFILCNKEKIINTLKVVYQTIALGRLSYDKTN
ncbi:hypothetical protein H1Q59_03125 [Holosporaceae bacterium 'Namur']|nr:hypothetical protein [Holosporaceae bacterium 'Namur']